MHSEKGIPSFLLAFNNSSDFMKIISEREVDRYGGETYRAASFSCIGLVISFGEVAILGLDLTKMNCSPHIFARNMKRKPNKREDANKYTLTFKDSYTYIFRRLLDLKLLPVSILEATTKKTFFVNKSF